MIEDPALGGDALVVLSGEARLDSVRAVDEHGSLEAGGGLGRDGELAPDRDGRPGLGLVEHRQAHAAMDVGRRAGEGGVEGEGGHHRRELVVVVEGDAEPTGVAGLADEAVGVEAPVLVVQLASGHGRQVATASATYAAAP